MDGDRTLASYHRRERAIIWTLLGLFGLAIIGTIGFLLIGGPQRTTFDAFWMTLQILSSVGDTGFERTQAEEIWSIFLMLVGVMAVFYLGVSVVRFVLDGELREVLGRRQLESKIKKLDDHFIICGFGRMGRALAETLGDRGARVLIIDASEEKIQEAHEQDLLYIHGDAMSEEVLGRAQLATARGLASCLSDDADNVFVTLTARDMNRDVTIVSKCNFEAARGKLTRAGANHVLSPNQLAADRALTKFMLPAVDELIEFVVHGSDLEVSKLSLERFPQAAGKDLRELGLPVRANLMVVAVVHADGSRTFNPAPDTTLATSDELVVIGSEGGVQKMVDLYGPEAGAA